MKPSTAAMHWRTVRAQFLQVVKKNLVALMLSFVRTAMTEGRNEQGKPIPVIPA